MHVSQSTQPSEGCGLSWGSSNPAPVQGFVQRIPIAALNVAPSVKSQAMQPARRSEVVSNGLTATSPPARQLPLVGAASRVLPKRLRDTRLASPKLATRMQGNVPPQAGVSPLAALGAPTALRLKYLHQSRPRACASSHCGGSPSSLVQQISLQPQPNEFAVVAQGMGNLAPEGLWLTSDGNAALLLA